MAAAPTTPNLDQGPPLPPNLQPPPPANPQQLAGQPSGDASGSADLMNKVAGVILQAKASMTQAMTYMPSLSPGLTKVIADMERVTGAEFAKGATPSPPQSPLMAGLVGGPMAGLGGGAGAGQ